MVKRRRLFHGPTDEPKDIALELPLSAEEGPPDLSPGRSWWGEIGVFAGGVIIAGSVIGGHPDYGTEVFGLWRIAGIAVGLVALGAGLLAVLQHSIPHATIKAVFVATTVTAIGTFALFGVEHLPATLPVCGTVAEPTLENRGPVYCEDGDGTLIRMSICCVKMCPDGNLSYMVDRGRRVGQWPGHGWAYELPSKGVPTVTHHA